MSNLEHNLAQFSGSDEWHRHWSGRLIYTDGIKYLAEEAGAYWLIDAIASWQPEVAKLGRGDVLDFQVWILRREPQPDMANYAKLTMHADLPGDALITQGIEYTDFPLDEIKLYLERGEYMTLMLPGER